MFGLPSFVVSHSVADDAARRYPGFTFVTEGIDAALAAAKVAAADRPVFLMGGANVAQQYLAAGLVDDAAVHEIPALPGDDEVAAIAAEQEAGAAAEAEAADAAEADAADAAQTAENEQAQAGEDSAKPASDADEGKGG